MAPFFPLPFSLTIKLSALVWLVLQAATVDMSRWQKEGKDVTKEEGGKKMKIKEKDERGGDKMDGNKIKEFFF